MDAFRLVIGSVGMLAAGAAGADPERGVLLQWFEAPWSDIEHRVPDLFMAGYEGVWLPPPSLASSENSAGYDVFDRFHLGKPGQPTTYGTEARFDAMISELHDAGARVYVDAILNHNSGRNTSQGFQAAGGWPGFWMHPESPARDKLPTDDWGDFHNGIASGYYQSENPGGPRYDLERGDLVALCDIAQESNHQFIRHPVAAGDPQNIPAGTLWNVPDPSNARLYPDLALPGFTFTNPGTSRNPGSQQWTLYPFNTADPLAGDAVTDNTTGLLMRWSQWMLDVHRVDGFRIDALKHAPSWFWDRYFDTACHLRRTTPDGRQVTPVTFGESVTDNSTIWTQYVRKDAFGQRDALDLNGAGKLRDQINGGGLGTWNALDDANSGHLDNRDDGFNNGSLGFNHVFSHDNGSTGTGSSMPGYPTDRQLGLYTHAYLLTRPGPAIVYHNARGVSRSGGFFPREGAPIALGWDPVAGALDSRLTRLVRIRNQYARGYYYPLNGTDPNNQSKDDVLIFEMAGSTVGGGTEGNMLVALNDRYDSGYDQRSVLTRFDPGTRLLELTGNAADPTVDPSGQIAEVLTVDGSGRVTIRVPRNRSSAGEHSLGYVIYGPAAPSGMIQLVGTSGQIAPDAANTTDVRQRLASADIVPGDSLLIRLTTVRTDAIDPNTDDDAAFRLDAGHVDRNGNGQVDFDHAAEATPGYERFLDVNQPLFGTANLNGLYEQTIDTSGLEEGYHYLSVVAFRHRDAGEAPILGEWRRVLYVDREDPAFAIENLGQSPESDQFEWNVRASDRTTGRVHVLWDLPDGVDPIGATSVFNQAAQRDRFDFAFTVITGDHGWHRLTVVAFEDSGRAGVGDHEVFVNKCPADLNRDGEIDSADFFAYLDLFAAGDPGADLTGDGEIDSADFFAYLDQFAAGC